MGLVKYLLKKQSKSRRTQFAVALGACAQLGALLASGYIPAAYAQSLTDEDISNYASAVFDIEATRLAAYEAASDILSTADSDLSILDTPLSCTRTRTSDMPDISRDDQAALRTVLITFCNEASAAAEANNLTPKRFNDITESHRGDPEVAERIQAAISEL